MKSVLWPDQLRIWHTIMQFLFKTLSSISCLLPGNMQRYLKSPSLGSNYRTWQNKCSFRWRPYFRYCVWHATTCRNTLNAYLCMAHKQLQKQEKASWDFFLSCFRHTTTCGINAKSHQSWSRFAYRKSKNPTGFLRTFVLSCFVILQGAA